MSIFYCDHIVLRGHAHQRCKDSAISGKTNNGGGYAIVSDGCSASSDSDIGSRLLSKGFEQHILESTSALNMKQCLSILTQVRKTVAPIIDMDIDPLLLDATIMSITTARDHFLVSVIGDGSIISINKHGSLDFTTIAYPDETPLYLSYLDDKPRLKTLHEERDCVKTVTSYARGKKVRSVVSSVPLLQFKYPFTDYRGVMVATDGIGTFHAPVNVRPHRLIAVDNISIINHLFSGISPQPRFLKETVGVHVKKYEKSHVYHDDDLSVSGILRCL